MGNNASQASQTFTKVKKSETVDATLYYFAGRGRADQVKNESRVFYYDFLQIRWIMAATGVIFDQKVVSSRDLFVNLAEYQLPFRQLPMVSLEFFSMIS
jgi:hypothetical protein